MNEKSWPRVLDSTSDNAKSKIANPKWVEIFAVVLTVAVGGARAEAQQPAKVPRIGYLASNALPAISARTEGFRQGLQELGYLEGKNIVIEYRSAEGKLDQVAPLAAELVRLKVDLIVSAGGNGVTSVAQRATHTIPIVMTNVLDPVGSGFIASLARPGGNITGLTGISSDLVGKRLELITETFPKLSRIAVFLDPQDTSKIVELKEAQAAASAWE